MNPEINKSLPSSRRSGPKPVLAGAVCGAFLLAACASTPEPTAQLQAAQQAIADAERAQATEHAADELSQARTKLASANTAVQRDDMDEAARLAEQARVDAELAAAKNAAIKAQTVNEEMKRSTQTLIEEMSRDADQDTTRTPGTTPMGTTGTGTTGTTGTGTGTGTATTDPTTTDTTGTTGGTP